MQRFVMVPAGSLRPGDVIAVAGTPVRYAQPLAEIHRHAYGQVELVCHERSVLGGRDIRVARTVPDQYPVALVRDPAEIFADTVEAWLSIHPEG